METLELLDRIENGEFKYIPGYDERYVINLTGDVWSLNQKCNMQPQKLTHYVDKKGYHTVQLYKKDAKRGMARGKIVARLLMETFCPPPNDFEKWVITYGNGDKNDIRFENLGWVRTKKLIRKRPTLVEVWKDGMCFQITSLTDAKIISKLYNTKRIKEMVKTGDVSKHGFYFKYPKR
jgi:hypothetical protein